MAEPVEGSRHAFTGARQRFLTPRDVPTKPSKDLTHFFHLPRCSYDDTGWFLQMSR